MPASTKFWLYIRISAWFACVVLLSSAPAGAQSATPAPEASNAQQAESQTTPSHTSKPRTQSADHTLSYREVTPPGVSLSWAWLAGQLLPNPQWVWSDEGQSTFGLRWAITPLLWSFAVDKRLNRWRTLTAETLVRHRGSLELLVMPEWIPILDDFADQWLLRAGPRLYLPLHHRGEYASMSLGGSYHWFHGEQGVSAEVGIYTLLGILGLVGTWSPMLTDARWTVTLNVQLF